MKRLTVEVLFSGPQSHSLETGSTLSDDSEWKYERDWDRGNNFVRSSDNTFTRGDSCPSYKAGMEETRKRTRGHTKLRVVGCERRVTVLRKMSNGL